MSKILCTQCGGLVEPDPPVSGKAAICPRCLSKIDSSAVVEPNSDAWSDSVNDWKATIARDRPENTASGSDVRHIAGDRPREIVYWLLGLIAFLIALIGVVLVARQLRPLVLAGKSAQPSLNELIRRLEVSASKDAEVEAARKEAACKIVALGPKAVETALDESTRFGEGGETLLICQPAAQALAEVGPEAADALGKALGAAKFNVRAGAANILRLMGPRGRGAKQPLVDALKDENHWVRSNAIEALGNMGAEAASAVGALVPLLSHPDAFTRRRAVEALGRIGPPAKQAVAALTKVRDTDHDQAVQRAARVALYQINLPELAAQSLKQAGKEVRDLIGKLQSGDEFAAVAAAKSLGEMGVRASDAVPALALALRNKSKWIREAAAKALGVLDGAARDVLPALQAAAADPEPQVRAAAQKAIDQIEGK